MTKLEQLIQDLCPNGVEYKKLGDIAIVTKLAGFEFTKYVEYSDTGSIIALRGLNVKNGHLDLSDVKYIDNSDLLKLTRSKLVKGDMLFTYVGTIGEVALIQENDKYYLAPNVALIRIKVDSIYPKFLMYYFQTNLFYNKQISKLLQSSSMKNIPMEKIRKFIIPLPPLEIQEEIVRILDNFTELNAELNAELTARRKQYEYYRDMLLDFGVHGGASECQWRTLGEISSYRRGSFPQPYGNKEWYDGEDSKPFVQVADIADNMLLVNDTKRKISLKAQKLSVFAPTGSIIISLQGSIGRIAITQYESYIDRTVAIFTNIAEKLNRKYFVYQLQRVFAEKEKNARGSTIKTITKEEFTNFLIPVPPLAEQERIVGILDRFDTLCNDLTIGLPAEIEAHRKQYEYYRDKLLDFKEKTI